MMGTSTGTRMSSSCTWRNESPSVLGIRGLTWAMTRPAFAAALLTISTDTPRLHIPRPSGGVTWIRAASSGNWPLENKPGNVGKEDRRVVAQPLLDHAADVLGDEEAVDAEVVGQFRSGVGGLAERQADGRSRCRASSVARATRALTSSVGWAQPVPMNTRLPG